MIKPLFPLLLILLSCSVQANDSLSLTTSLTSDGLGLTSGQQLSSFSPPSLATTLLWPRVRQGFKLEETADTQLVARHEQWYANRPDYVARMMTRANRYLYYITTEVERRGMPSEIALLPMIESAFNPGSNSTSNAAGIWQFIPSTGLNFGLKQNWWYDGRRDIIGATTGALNYLEKLHNMFGDWELALAAYNWGEGAVQRAQERNRKLGLATDYASLKLPDETRNYLPKLIAIKHIVSDPARFGLELPGIANEPYFASIATTRRMDVELAAQLAEISKEEFVALNPAHNRPVILQRNSEDILLPVNKVEAFRANLQSYDKPLVSWQPYQPRKGERLDKLAPRFGLSVEKLKSVNGLSTRANVSGGETLLVPLGDDASAEDGQFEVFNMHLHPTGKSTPDNDTATLKYTARSGDTLDKLARRYHVSVATLRGWNGNSKHIKAGQTINVGQTKKESKHGHMASQKHEKLAYRDKAASHQALSHRDNGKKTSHKKSSEKKKAKPNKPASSRHHKK